MNRQRQEKTPYAAKEGLEKRNRRNSCGWIPAVILSMFVTDTRTIFPFPSTKRMPYTFPIRPIREITFDDKRITFEWANPNGIVEWLRKNAQLLMCSVQSSLVSATNYNLSTRNKPRQELFLFSILRVLLLFIFQDQWINMNFRTRVHDKLAFCQQFRWHNWRPFESSAFFLRKTINFCWKNEDICFLKTDDFS